MTFNRLVTANLSQPRAIPPSDFPAAFSIILLSSRLVDCPGSYQILCLGLAAFHVQSLSMDGDTRGPSNDEYKLNFVAERIQFTPIGFATS
jgi:hypothetical protein